MTDKHIQTVQTVTKNTLVPMGIVGALLVAAYSIGADRSTVANNIGNNKAAIQAIQKSVGELKKDVGVIEKTVNRIEGKLNERIP